MIFLVQFGINKHLFCWSLKNLLVLIYSKLHSKSCDYLYIFPIFQLTSLTFSEVELCHLIRSGSLRSKLLEVVGGTENRAREGHKPEK